MPPRTLRLAEPRTLASAWLLAFAGCAADATSDAVEPPPQEEIFTQEPYLLDTNGDGFLNDLDDLDGDGEIDRELRYYFDDGLFRSLCVVPDADSFDDYEDAELGIARGTKPISEDCEADGIVTGPLHEELYPSKWCKVPDCKRSAGSNSGGGKEY